LLRVRGLIVPVLRAVVQSFPMSDSLSARNIMITGHGGDQIEVYGHSPMSRDTAEALW